MALAQAQIEQLNGLNYRVWAIRAKAGLTMLDLWDCIGPYIHQQDTVGYSITTGDAKARAFLISCVADKYVGMVDQSNTAAAAWISLRNACPARVDEQCQELLSQIHSLNKDGSETVIQYVARAERLQGLLETRGGGLSDCSLVRGILRGLPTEFKELVDICLGEQPITVAMVLPLLLKEERWHAARGPTQGPKQPSQQVGSPSSSKGPSQRLAQGPKQPSEQVGSPSSSKGSSQGPAQGSEQPLQQDGGGNGPQGAPQWGPQTYPRWADGTENPKERALWMNMEGLWTEFCKLEKGETELIKQFMLRVRNTMDALRCSGYPVDDSMDMIFPMLWNGLSDGYGSYDEMVERLQGLGMHK